MSVTVLIQTPKHFTPEQAVPQHTVRRNPTAHHHVRRNIACGLHRLDRPSCSQTETKSPDSRTGVFTACIGSIDPKESHGEPSLWSFSVPLRFLVTNLAGHLVLSRRITHFDETSISVSIAASRSPDSRDQDRALLPFVGLLDSILPTGSHQHITRPQRRLRHVAR